MGFSFSFYSSYRKNKSLTAEQVEALYTPVIDILADVNIITIGEDITVSVANYGSNEFINMIEDHIRAAIFATMDSDYPTQLVIHTDEDGSCNRYVYIAHNAVQALVMELQDLNNELRALIRKRNSLIEQIKELKKGE